MTEVRSQKPGVGRQKGRRSLTSDFCLLPSDEAFVSRAVLDRLAAGETLMSWNVHHSALRWLLGHRLVHVTPGCRLVLPT